MSKFSILTLSTLLCLLFVTLVPESDATLNPKTVCYYESWAHYRTGDGKRDPSEIDTSLCSHIVYSYFGIDSVSHELKWLDPYLMQDLNDVEKFAKAKGNSKALIAVGGATQSTLFETTAIDERYRETFVKSVVNFLTKYNYDGIMIDWYGLNSHDSEFLIKLLDKFDEKFASTDFIMALTVPATVSAMDAYNVPKIIPYVDFLNVLTLDYSGSWSKKVNHASPLPEQIKTLEEYHKRGAPRSKLLAAIPFFARTWRLASPQHQEINDLAEGGGAAGPFTQTEGLLNYNELCAEMVASPSHFSLTRDEANDALYAIYLHSSVAEFISFEDTKTLAIKAKNLTTEGYGGVTVYTISGEDVHGACGKRNPLLHALVDNYNKENIPDKPITTITPPTHGTTEKTTDIPGVFTCHKEGNFRDPIYCYKYYTCTKGDLVFEKSTKFCDRHDAYDEIQHKCVDAKKVPGC